MPDLIAFERPTVPQPWPDAEVERLFRLRQELGWSWEAIAADMGRTASGVKSKFKYEQNNRAIKSPAVPFVRETIPDSVLKEQARRVVAFGDRSATQAALGDPPHQYSALAARQAV